LRIAAVALVGSGLLSSGVHAVAAGVQFAGNSFPLEALALSFLPLVVAFALAAIALVRTRLQPLAAAIAAPLLAVAWPVLGQAFPPWGGTVGVVLFSLAAFLQLSYRPRPRSAHAADPNLRRQTPG
jgi:hypothetical protein